MSPSSGFELRPVDRLLQRRHAQGCCAAVAAVIGAGLLLAVSPSVHTPRELWQRLLHCAGIFGFFGGLFAIGGWWTVHTWKALWRRGRSSRERLLYDEGVRGVRGVGFTLVVIFIVVTWLGLTADAPRLWGPMTIGAAFAAIFFGFPVALHFGYFCGRTFADIVGEEPDSTLEIREPPLSPEVMQPGRRDEARGHPCH
jgi:hypothetical protein